MRMMWVVWIAAALFLGCDGNKNAGKGSEAGGAQGADKASSFVAGAKTDRFTVAMSADPETFDVGRMSGSPEGFIAFNAFEGLMMPGPTTEGLDDAAKLVVYGVAESHTLSEDGRTYTFKLRPDAKWSDGQPVTAVDFEQSWQRILTPNFSADYVQMLYVIDGAEGYSRGEHDDWLQVGVKVKGKHELEVTLKTPTPYFLELLAFYTFFPVPHHVLKQHGEAWTKPEHIVGNGPYKVTKYTPQQEILLDKNEHYWDAANVKIDKARLRIITELDAVVKAYETGELHWTGAGLSMSQITKLLTHPDFRKEPMLGVYFYRVNVVKGGALGDVKVRQALSLAIDRDSLVDNVMNGLFTVARTFVPEGMAGYQSIIKAEDNVSKAKAMLKEAGFESGKDLGTIELLYNTDQNHKLVAEAVQQMWKQSLGLDVKLVNKEWKTYLQDLDTLSYQVARAGWIGDYNDPMTFLDMWVTNNGNNDTGWSHEEYDTLIERARREPRVSERVKLLQQAEAILLEQGPVIPIYFYTNNMLVSSAIEGFEPHNRDVHLLKYMSFKDAAK